MAKLCMLIQIPGIRPDEARVLHDAQLRSPGQVAAADEDHVACQRGRRFEARLVYIHEGWETNGKRREIEQPLYLSSVDEDTETLWEKVWEFTGGKLRQFTSSTSFSLFGFKVALRRGVAIRSASTRHHRVCLYPAL